jgi:hypothetical protein
MTVGFDEIADGGSKSRQARGISTSQVKRSNAIYRYPNRLTGRWDEPSDLSFPIDRK